MRGKAFAANFQSVGTLDNTAYLCIEAALIWRQRLTWNGKKGEEAISTYLHHLSVAGGKRAAAVLGTETLDNPQQSLRCCATVNVRLPLPQDFRFEEPYSGGLGVPLMMRMMNEHNTVVEVFPYMRHWWVRLNAQVYLTADEFEAASILLDRMCNEVLGEDARTA